MDLDIRKIREFYDSDVRDYNLTDLLNIGISHDNADFMIGIGVPEEYNDFVFYESNGFQKLLVGDEQIIKIGHYSFLQYGLYVKEGRDELFTSSSYHKPQIYILNKNLRTFFLFHLIKNEVAKKMIQEGEYSSYNFAIKLSKLYEQIDPVAMKDVEGYWSHLIEDYETGL